MAEYIVMPKLGFDMREGVLNNWVKQVGEMVNRGDVVAEIESDKAGVVAAILVENGQPVEYGQPLFIIE